MKIMIMETSTNKPLTNTQIKLHVQGDTNTLTLKTDQSGKVDVSDNLKGKQIASSSGNGQGPWTTAADGATIKVNSKQTQQQGNRSHSGGQSGSQSGGQTGMNQGSKNKNKETQK